MALIFQAKADFAGLLGMNITCNASFWPTSREIRNFASDPISALRTAGIALTAEAELPLGIAHASFIGRLTASELYLNARAQVAITGISFDFLFFVQARAGQFLLELQSTATLGPFARLNVEGSLSSESGLSAQASLDTRLLGLFRATGRLEIQWNSTQQCVRLDFNVAFCGFGQLSFVAAISGDSWLFQTSVSVQVAKIRVGGSMAITVDSGVTSVSADFTVSLPDPFGEKRLCYPSCAGRRRLLAVANSTNTTSHFRSPGGLELLPDQLLQ